jgi:hypothetical protein
MSCPADGTSDYYQINAWERGRRVVSEEFRLRRALRVIPVTPQSMQHATAAIDSVVRAIEDRVAHERGSGHIRRSWSADSNDKDTCAACDFRVSCERFNGWAELD